MEDLKPCIHCRIKCFDRLCKVTGDDCDYEENIAYICPCYEAEHE